MNRHHLQDLIEPVVEGLGYELVRVMTNGNVNITLQVMIENKDYSKDIAVEDCVKVSKALSEMLDEKDPISDNYNLEVSSPGIDRPLTKLENFERFKDLEAKVETSVEVDGRKRFKGMLKGVNGQNVIMDMDGVEYSVPFDDIAKAKLVMNDELMALYEKDVE